VATGFASLPRDISPPPREWAERFFNIQHWTEMPRGGHWAAMEEPELLADDLRAFLPSLARSAAVSSCIGRVIRILCAVSFRRDMRR